MVAVSESNEAALAFDLAHTLFQYDAKTGKLYWRIKRKGVNPGDEVGPNSRSYLKVQVNNKTYLQHRLVWLMAYGEWPGGQIDHIDRDKRNNRLENLRVVTHSENQLNRDAADRAKHYRYICGNYYVYMKLTGDGKSTYLGCYNTLAEVKAVISTHKKEV